MKSKKWIKIFTIFSFSIIFMTIAINLVIDPLKIFHKPYFFKDRLEPNMRLQAAGIINNYNFDSIILGTSMLENTSSKEASNVLGGEFVNISLSGSDFYERSLILTYVLKNKKIKKIIYSLDENGLIHSRMGKNDFPISNFDFLYDNNPINDLKVYINTKLIKCITNNHYEPCIGKKLNFDTPNEWFSKKKENKKFGSIDNWFTDLTDSKIINRFKEMREVIINIEKQNTLIEHNEYNKNLESEKYLKKYLLNFIKKNPSTEFILVLPPYSRIKNAIDSQYKVSEFSRTKNSIKFLVNSSKKYTNLKIYGWGDKNFPDKLSNYKDLSHYHPKINSNMLYWIKENNGLLTQNNVEHYLETFEKKSLDYDLTKFKDKIEQYLYKEKN